MMNSDPKFLQRWLKPQRPLLFCALFALQAGRLGAATYIVSNLADSGAGSLRQAILNANGNPGLDTIVFNLSGTGPFTITPSSALPAITDPVVIDGTTQPGYAGTPLIEINGTNQAAGTAGLYITAGGSTVSGLAINRCPLDGIRLESLGTNVIQGNFLGTDPTGTVALANGEGGIVLNGSPGNLIGGTNASEGNLISGGNLNGISVIGLASSGNVISGNYIGTTVTGMGSLGNLDNGIEILSAPGNTIGGTNAGSGNIISGNQQDGVLISSAGASGNIIQGNFLGVDATGSTALPNTENGVTIDGAAGNIVGGPTGGNVISGNGENGVALLDSGGGTNIVQGNLIGTDYTGTVQLANVESGVYIQDPGNTIGGPAALGNVISGNDENGIFIYGPTATNNLIAGNYIGTDITGETYLGNKYAGITVSSAPANTIGGTIAGDGNVISANGNSGISLNGTTTATVIQGNYIGTDAIGTTSLANLVGGIFLYNSGSNLIGGAVAGAGNLISGNYQEGISVGDPGANFNIIQGNFIGTMADGFSPLGNQLHNIDFSDTASNNLVGGTTPAADNHIAFAQAYQYDGVRIRDGCLGNFISRNCIFSNANLGIVIGVIPGLNTSNLVTLTNVVSDASTTVIQGFLNSYATGQFLIQFYENRVPSPSGYGEGLSYVGSANITIGADGQANFTLTLPLAIPPGTFLSATATDSANTTWEFSADIQVLSSPSLTISQSTAGTVPATISLTWPTSPAGFILQQTTNLTPPVLWSAATNTVIVSETTNCLIATPSGAEMFYRIQFQ
jgi:titin